LRVKGDLVKSLQCQSIRTLPDLPSMSNLFLGEVMGSISKAVLAVRFILYTQSPESRVTIGFGGDI
jgi:hypothetical protein